MEFFRKDILDLKSQNNFRFIKNIDRKEGKYIFINEKKLLNLSSNNYLGIGNNKTLEEEFFKNNKNYSFASTSSRLLTGNEKVYFELENLLTKLFKKEKALIFNSGYAANLGIISSLLSKNDAVFSDKLNHASIIDGIKLSDAKSFRFSHLDYNHLENLLEKERKNYKNSIIITESLFSMDGDFANLERLIYLKEKYECLLIVDEAHSFGLYGKNGLGFCEEKNLIDNVDLIVSGFGKATGSFGAFCVASNDLIDYIINKARSFIFSTAIPPINIAWTKFVIESIFPKYRKNAKNLLEVSEKFRKSLEEKDYFSNSKSYIIPIIIPNEEKLEKLQKDFYENGFYVLPIRYPTVAKNSSRFRISLTSDIDCEDLEKILDIL